MRTDLETFTLQTLVPIIGTLALLAASCAWESVPAERRRQAESVRDEYERQRRAEAAQSERKAAEDFKRQIAAPGSLSIQESDARIAALKSTSALERTSAAGKLGDAKGRRGVEPLVAALRAEADPMTFGAIASALGNIGDPRATVRARVRVRVERLDMGGDNPLLSNRAPAATFPAVVAQIEQLLAGARTETSLWP